MLAIVAFFKPTKIKIVFLVEWILFILITVAQGKLKTNHQVFVAAYPLVFFYLVACMLAALSQRLRQLTQTWILFLLAICLIILDQVIKVTVLAFVPYQTPIPIVEDWLYLAYERNFLGSWIISAFNIQFSGIFIIQWGLAITVLLCSILCYRYYITINRKSLWADVAFLGVFVAVASWVCDMSFRGHIVDYINLPGLVTADLKDVLMTIGIAAFFAEIFDNPNLFWRWTGWQDEKDDLIRLVKSFCRFSIQEFHNVYNAMMNILKKIIKSE
jgi:lipoprotein signal peptidase